MQPNFDQPFVVDTDALAYAIGAVLHQRDQKGKAHPIAFLSKTLDATQCNWDIYDKELFTVIYALTIWRQYLMGGQHQVVVNMDHHNLQYFRDTRDLN